jgi:Zn-dependent protease
MANFSYTVTTVMGIPIRLNISILLMIFILMSNFGISMGLALGIGLITSICLHELAHSYVAIKKGCRVVSIDLMLIGGAARMASMPEKPMDEFLMAIVGPATSAVIGVALYFGIPESLLTSTPYPLPFILIVLKYTGMINIGLAVFNLLPAFPMDGGRIFRSLLAHKMGRLKATFIASRLGKVLAICMALYAFLANEEIIYTLLLIAAFVFMSAGNEYKYVLMQEQAKQNRDTNPLNNLFNQFRNLSNKQPPPVEEDEPFDSDVVEITPPPYEKKKKNKTSKIFKQ